MSTTLKRIYLRCLTNLGKTSLKADSVFGHPYRITLGDVFSETPFYNPHSNVGEILATAAWVMNVKKPVVYDIGGHCGYIASQLAFILKNQKPNIYSFEPVAPTFSDLMQTVSSLSLQGVVHPVAVALSNKNGVVRLNYSKWNSMLAQIIPESKASNNRSGFDEFYAPAITLDDFITTSGFPNVIKIDVEGWEVNVFRGASSLLNSEQIINTGICIEWNPEALGAVGLELVDLYRFFENFRFFYLNDYQGQSHPELAEINTPLEINHVCNFFLIHRSSPRANEWLTNFNELKKRYNVRIS